MATWKIGYRFNDKTGEKKPWEVMNQVFENGRRVALVQWGSFKTEAAASKSIPQAISRMVDSPTHGIHEFENIGKIAR